MLLGVFLFMFAVRRIHTWLLQLYAVFDLITALCIKVFSKLREKGIVKMADNSHEMFKLIFSEKKLDILKTVLSNSNSLNLVFWGVSRKPYKIDSLK